MAETPIGSMSPLRVRVALGWTPDTLFVPAGIRVAIRVSEYRLDARPPEIPETPEAAAEDACMIVLCRANEVELDGSGNPAWWLPAKRGAHGTYATTREIGWGTVLSEDESNRAPTDTMEDEQGLNLAGIVGDAVETLTIHCDVSMMDPADKPRPSDEFTLRGVRWCIFGVEMHSEVDSEKEMTVSAIRWPSLTAVKRPTGVTPTMAWR